MNFAKDYKKKKFVFVLSSEIEPWQAVNVVGHLSLSIGHRAKDFLGRDVLVDASGTEHKGISRYPVIALNAKPAQLRNLITKLRESELLFVDYPQEMLDTRTDDDLSEAISKNKEEDMEYYGVAIFGDTGKVDELTKKFGLWKGS